MKINNLLEYNNSYYIISPYLNGLNDIKKSFTPNAEKLVFNPSEAEFREKNLHLADRVKYLLTGIILLIPIINIVVAATLQFFATQNFQIKDDHQMGGGVLPYCIDQGHVYFLLSKEGYGPAKNTWCDFGGAKDPGETTKETAIRECWEESRGILGDKKTIEDKISPSTSIGKKYGMYFLKVDNPKEITNRKFLKKKFWSHCRMEKTALAWVKADDVFKAAMANKRVNFSMKLRGYFAKTVHETFSNPKEKAVLEEIYRDAGLTLKHPTKNWYPTAAAAACITLLAASAFRFLRAA